MNRGKSIKPQSARLFRSDQYTSESVNTTLPNPKLSTFARFYLPYTVVSLYHVAPTNNDLREVTMITLKDLFRQ